MHLSGAVFPNATDGVRQMLDGADLLGFTLLPRLTLDEDAFSPRTDSAVLVHVQRDAVTTGEVSRVEEVRFTVYGPNVLTSIDIAEAVVAAISGEGVHVPAVDGVGPFSFDRIEHRNITRDLRLNQRERRQNNVLSVTNQPVNLGVSEILIHPERPIPHLINISPQIRHQKPSSVDDA